MYDDNYLVSSTRLVEAVFDIAEADVDLLTLSGGVSQPVLVDFQVANRLLANKIGTNHEIVKLVTATIFAHDELL